MNPSNFELPQNINSHRKRLAIFYELGNQQLLQEIIETAAIYIFEDVSQNNFDGVNAHEYIFFVPEELIRKFWDINEQKKLEEKIKEDLNKIAKTVNEYIDKVTIEIFDESNPICRQASRPSKARFIAPEEMKVWKPGFIKLFISHRDKYKKEVSQIAEELEKYDISCFVAHDSIEPLSKWKDEIWKGLLTMDLLLAYLTDDFSDSAWTDQEIGIAIGRRVPVIPLKLQKKDPYGFIYDDQAIKGVLGNPKELSHLIAENICEKLDLGNRIKDAVIRNFSTSKSYFETNSIFSILEKFSTFTEDQMDRIISAFHSNNQLYTCVLLLRNNRFTNFICEHTGKNYKFEKGRLIFLP